MAEKKNKGGRPRVHATDADRSRAYYERKKTRMKELEAKVKKLEEKTPIDDDFDFELEEIESFDWQKITPNEISLMDSQKLQQMTKIFREKITETPAIKVELQNIVRFVYGVQEDISIKKALKLLDPVLDNLVITLQESNQQQTLLYLMEAELANRERLQIRDYKLEILQTKVEELKKESKEKELKIKQ